MKKLIIGVVTLVLFSACASGRKGYGCQGKESWNHMQKRINKPY